MKNAKIIFCFTAVTFLVSILACGSSFSTPAPTPASTAIPPTEQSALSWMRTAGGIKADQSWAVVTDAQGNLYWGTHQQKPNELFTDMIIYKYSPDGDILWETHWGGDYQEKLFILTVSPPYLFAGGEQDHSINITQADMVVLAIGLEDGQVVWEFTYDQGVGYEEVDGLVAEGDEIYVSGWTTSAENGSDVGLLKLSRKGELIWATSWGGPGFDHADGQMVVDDEYIYISGRYGGENILLGGYGLLAKFSKDSGEYIRHVLYDEKQFYDGYSLASDGEYLYITGITIVPRSGGGDGQIFVQKWDKDFNRLWEYQWGGPAGDQARAIGIDTAGRIIVAGNTTLQNDRQIVLLILNQNGDLLKETLWGGAEEDLVHGLWIDGDYAYLAGETRTWSKGQNDALLLKIHLP